MTKLTPMMKQYRRLKASVKDAILLFRLGDFYEMFNEDAQKAAPILEIALTSRKTTPMCGIPYHAASRYIAKLLKAGLKVAICEQVEDPSESKGIVKREVVRVITPGTTLEEELLVREKNNYLAAVHRMGQVYGLAYIDLSTGDFRVTELLSPGELTAELIRVAPSECLYPENLGIDLKDITPPNGSPIVVTPLENWMFDYDLNSDLLKKHFGVSTLDGFGCQQLIPGISAAGGVLQYINTNLRSSLQHVCALNLYYPSQFMTMDAVSQANLEIIEPLRGNNREATLLGILDRTMTSMGSRTLRNWLLQPLLDHEEIRERTDGVEELVSAREILSECRSILKDIRDVQRIISRVTCGRINARDLVSLRQSLGQVPILKQAMNEMESGIWSRLTGELEISPGLTDKLEKALVDDPPITVKEGGMIKDGYHPELDELRRLSREGKNWISEYQKKEIERTGIKSLKVRHNKVFGYYIEVTKPNLDLVPDNYIRKQTLVNSERFITEELKNYENKVLGSQEKAAALEYTLFTELRDKVGERAESIQRCAGCLGEIDALQSLAEAALKNGYIKPELEDSARLEIINGRHPVVEQILIEERFVGNDTVMDGEDNQIFIITGPNMAGKSTYIRQVALIVLMAQIGSFVPADRAVIGTVDRIFARVGASDELTRGQSTFMVEMTETANILHHATPRSLVILDEIGRGTSTFDGISIAWAVAEYLHNNDRGKARTLFATHYHELTELEIILPGVKNFNVAVREWNDKVIFIRKVLPGGTDKSYGIQVARLAGLPRSIIERAKVILEALEAETLTPDGAPRFAIPSGSEQSSGPRQLHLFETGLHPVVTEIRNMQLEHMTPFEAMQRLKDLKEQVDSDRSL